MAPPYRLERRVLGEREAGSTGAASATPQGARSVDVGIASGHALTVGGGPAITGGSGNQPSASYRIYRLYRVQMLVSFAIFGATVPLVVAVGDRDGPTLLFLLVWIAVLGWNAYWFLLRLCYRLDLQDGILHWRAPLRSGHAPLVGLRALPWSPQPEHRRFRIHRRTPRPSLGPSVAAVQMVDQGRESAFRTGMI
jgi:hypothetical protein